MDHSSVRKTERLGIRVASDQHGLLQMASAAMHTTLSEFVISNATRAAEEVLADRRTFALSEETWSAFRQALDRPAQDIPGLRELLVEPTVLDS